MNISIASKVYEFTHVIFGINASLHVAQFVVQHNAKLNSSALPKAAQTVCKSTHKDDSLDFVETIEAIKLHHDLTTLWK